MCTGAGNQYCRVRMIVGTRAYVVGWVFRMKLQSGRLVCKLMTPLHIDHPSYLLSYVRDDTGVKPPPKFKAALRVDPLLSGNWPAVKAALEEAKYETTIEGAKQFLRDWAKVGMRQLQDRSFLLLLPLNSVEILSYQLQTTAPKNWCCAAVVQTMNPIYLMASTPAGFSYGFDDFASTQNGWLACCASPFMLNQPGGPQALLSHCIQQTHNSILRVSSFCAL